MSQPAPPETSKPPSSGVAILVAMVLGGLWGGFARANLDGAIYIGFLGHIFKAVLMMLIVPLVLASIVTGIAGLGDVRKLGKIGARTLGYYALTTAFAVVLGLGMVHTIQPGRGQAGQGESLQVKLDVSQGKHKKLLSLAQKEEAAGRVESARALLDLYLSRYGSEVDGLTAARVEEQRNRLGAPPPYRVEQRRLEAETRWRAETGMNAVAMTVPDFLAAQVDKIFKNPFEALAHADVLAIIVFALLLGGCLTTLGDQGRPLIACFEGLNGAMMVLTDLVMRYVAPLGVFGLMADVTANLGGEVLSLLARYMTTVSAGLLVHGLIVLPLLLKLTTDMGPGTFFRGARPALAVAFSTASSSATLPVSLEVAEDELGCDPKHSGFVLPLGATVNMDGTALYEAVAALFIAQIYNIELSAMQQVLVALTATLAAVGAAGIPSAGTVTMVMVLNAVGLPLDGIALILAVDRVLDMLRTTVNVSGDLTVAVIVDRAERRDFLRRDLREDS